MSATVSNVRERAARARERLGRRTILFLDEIHRFLNKAQDAPLPESRTAS